MSVTIQWDNQAKSIIRFTAVNPWTWEQAEFWWVELNRMAYSVEHRISCIVDASGVTFVPRNALQTIYDRYSLLPPNVNMIVIVSAPTIVKAIIDVLRLMRPETFKRYQFVDKIDDAYHLISVRDAKAY